jgi:prepilin-type N-terminal cleavage/methylation domain-containing protein
MTMNNKSRNHKGFSFIEVMLAVFLIVVGIVAAISLMAKSMKESLDSRSQIIAGLLAQEGVELVRNIRDNNWVQTPPATTFSNLPTIDRTDCVIDFASANLPDASCTAAQSAVPLYIAVNGFYNKSASGAQTKFRRKIDIDYDTNVAATANTAIATSMVTWLGGAYPSVANCNSSNKCAYAQVTLSKWGE